MSETVVEKRACDKCGADVREGTAYCYNCGSPIAVPKPEEPIESISSNGDQSAAEKRSKAARERKKSRVVQRREVEYTWEPIDDLRAPLAAAVVIAVLVFVVVFLLVFLK